MKNKNSYKQINRQKEVIFKLIKNGFERANTVNTRNKSSNYY